MRKVGPAWSLKGRQKEDRLPDIPGPGAYSAIKVETTPSYSISKSNRQDISKSSLSPGPGAYNAKQLEPKKSAVFGSSSRMDNKNIPQLPGPGNYQIKSSVDEGPKYSLRGRVKVPQKDDSPGPGQYSPNKSLLETTFVHSFSKEQI